MQKIFYLPPISWFSDFVKSGEPLSLEYTERWQKQSLRNRCYIDSPNGKLALSIPIDKSTAHGPIKDVLISKQFDWQHQHWFAFETSYYNSPFFEYLQDDFRPVYEKEWKYLADLNETLIDICLNLMELPHDPQLTKGFFGTENSIFQPKPYYQVYKYKRSQEGWFLPDLSIIDLLFNEGPEAVLYL